MGRDATWKYFKGTLGSERANKSCGSAFVSMWRRMKGASIILPDDSASFNVIRLRIDPLDPYDCQWNRGGLLQIDFTPVLLM